MYRHMARASRSPWFAVLCLALVAVVSSARQVTAAPTICSRDPKEDLSGYTLLTQENLKANCVSFSAGNPKTPDCVLRQGGLFAVQSNLSVGSITIPWKTSLRFTDCGPLSRITFDAQHVIVDGSLVIGSRAVPYSGRLVITLHVGKEIKFGDYEPRAPGIAFDNKTNFGGLTVLEGTTNKFIGVRPGGQLDVFGMPKISWTRLSKTANEGQRYICVAERRATLNWTVGDELAISPTDFHGSRSTERTKITYLQRNNEATCGMNMTTVGISNPIRVRKYGNAIVDGYDKRMSAEVANMDRNVAIQGALDDIKKDPYGYSGYGGHTVYLYNARVRMRDVEFAYMGQANHMARYPVHWHLAADASTSYLINSVVKDSFQRCVTLHGTWGTLRVQDNVCFNITGHALYWENGIEVDTVVERNLVLLVKEGSMICSDNAGGLYTDDKDLKVKRSTASDGPSAFWIVNGANTVNDNVAAAIGDGSGTGIGYWFAIPQFIMSPSYEFFRTPKVQKLLKVPAYYPNQNPTTVPMRSFRGNVAHSLYTGFKADGILRSAGGDPGSCVKESAGVWKPNGTSHFDDFLTYKAQVGVWINSDNAVMKRPAFYDVARGLYIEKLQQFQQTKVPRSELPTCYETAESDAMELCYGFYTTGAEEPGSFIRIIDSYYNGDSKNQLSPRENPGCQAYYISPSNEDCRTFGQVGVMMSMGYAYFEGMRVEGYISRDGVNRGLFGHKEDPGYNAGPFYVWNVTYKDASNPLFMDSRNQAGMWVLSKAGSRDLVLHSPDGTLANPKDTNPIVKNLIALGKGVTASPPTSSMLDATWKPQCYCPPRFGFGCLCPGNMRSVFVQLQLPFSSSFPAHSTVQNPRVIAPSCNPPSRTSVNSSWGIQHDCIQDESIYASGTDLSQRYLAQFAGGAVMGMPAIKSGFIVHVEKLVPGLVKGTEQMLSFNLFQQSQHPDQMRKLDYFIAGVYFPNISVASIRLNMVQVYLDLSTQVQTIPVPACGSMCTCCPINTPKPFKQPVYTSLGVLMGADYLQWKSNPAGAPTGSPAKRFADAGAFPVEANSLDSLKAGPAHGFFFDKTPGKQAFYYKYSWVTATPNPKEYEKGLFNVDPLVQFGITFS